MTVYSHLSCSLSQILQITVGSKTIQSFNFICLGSTRFVLINVLTLMGTINPNVWAKPMPENAKISLPVKVRRLNTSLLKLPDMSLENLA